MTDRILCVRISEMQPYKYWKLSMGLSYLHAIVKIGLAGNTQCDYFPNQSSLASEAEESMKIPNYDKLVAIPVIQGGGGIDAEGTMTTQWLPRYLNFVNIKEDYVTFSIPDHVDLNVIDNHGGIRRLLGDGVMNAMAKGHGWDMFGPHDPSIEGDSGKSTEPSKPPEPYRNNGTWPSKFESNLNKAIDLYRCNSTVLWTDSLGLLQQVVENLGEKAVRRLSRREILDLANSQSQLIARQTDLGDSNKHSRSSGKYYGREVVLRFCGVNRHGVYKKYRMSSWGANDPRNKGFDEICRVGLLVAKNYGEPQNFFGLQDWFLEEIKFKAINHYLDIGKCTEEGEDLADKANWLVFSELAKRKRDRAVNNESIEMYSDLTDTLQGSWRP